ncbi:Dimethylallyltranstransferase [Dactylellina cionopaga]|nr:Dimethylallyltranstransferase [Dactylellina cionopaga]
MVKPISEKSLSENGERPGFLPPLVPYENSVAVPPKYIPKDYWSRIEPRISCVADAEAKIILEVHRDWEETPGSLPARPGALSSLGGVTSLIYPEADPQRLLNTSALSAIAFIEDDMADGELFLHKRERDQETKDKKIFNMIEQKKCKLFVEMLEGDPASFAYVNDYEKWIADQYKLDGFSRCGEPKDLDTYLSQRLLSIGQRAGIQVIRYGGKFNFTREQYLSKFDHLEDLAVKAAIITADISSTNIEWVYHALHERLGYPTSVVFLYMRWHDMSVGEAKDVLKREHMKIEEEFLRLRDKAWEESGHNYEIGRYLTQMGLLISGNIIWHIGHQDQRHFVDPGHPLCPQPEYKLKDLPRRHDNSWILAHWRAKISGQKDGQPVKNPGQLDEVHDSDFVTDNKESDTHMAPWLAKYAQLSDEIVMEPCDYVASMPSKKVRHAAIRALNIHYKVPGDKIEIIQSVIDLLHSSSLIVDDIEDGSTLRRGNPSAHMVFGVPQALNSANYLFVKALTEIQKLSPSAVAIYTDELRNLHVGQSLDLHWTFHARCPSEREYIQMIDGSKNLLFAMNHRFIRLTHKIYRNWRNFNLEDIFTLIARFFQIRDDYQNLNSADYSAEKGDLSDLDEGKYSFMLIHALRHTKDNRLRSLLRIRSQQPEGRLSKEQKDLIMKILAQTKSMEYTCNVLIELQDEIEKRLDAEEKAAGAEKNWVMRSIMERLRMR